MNKFTDLAIYKRLEEQKIIRIVALGSSNTQRFMVQSNWFDFVEIGFKIRFGADCGQFINCGVSGNTTEDLLARFERDVAIFAPHLTILTVGGNDANPARDVSPAVYRANLNELIRRLHELGSQVILQTYYACDLELIEPTYAQNLVDYMQIIREVAHEHKLHLHDNFKRWEYLRQYDIRLYRLLMRDKLHVNPTGTMVIGLDLMRRFELPLPDENLPYCHAGLMAQGLLDQLEKRKK